MTTPDEHRVTAAKYASWAEGSLKNADSTGNVTLVTQHTTKAAALASLAVYYLLLAREAPHYLTIEQISRKHDIAELMRRLTEETMQATPPPDQGEENPPEKPAELG